MLTAEYGGTGGKKIEGGLVVEEPDIEIGAGVSSKGTREKYPTHRLPLTNLVQQSVGACRPIREDSKDLAQLVIRHLDTPVAPVTDSPKANQSTVSRIITQRLPPDLLLDSNRCQVCPICPVFQICLQLLPILQRCFQAYLELLHPFKVRASLPHQVLLNLSQYLACGGFWYHLL